MDHADLVAEINLVEKMTPAERLKHAKKRRAYQLKQYNHYEKKIEKEYSKKRKHPNLNSMKRPSKRHKKTAVNFANNVKILEAAARNDVEEVRNMLMNNVDPNLTNEDGLTALHQCCIDESKELLTLLLEYGAHVNARDSELWTPLHAAATCGHIHLCEILVNNNADLLAVNADGNMPYDICEDEETLDFVENEMAKRGITQEQIDETRLVTELQMLDDLKNYVNQGGKLENIRDQNGVSPLHIAAANGYLEVANFLLQNKLPVNVRDDDSWEPIHAAACWQQMLMLDLLVQYGADIDSKTKMHDTPFDICDDPDIKQKILDMKDELESKKKRFGSESIRKNNRPNNRSASMRRSSMRSEKSALFMKELKEEAAHFGLRSTDSNEDISGEEDDDDDDDDYDKDNDGNEPGIASVNDVELIFDDMNSNERSGGQRPPLLTNSYPQMNGKMNGNHSSEPSKHVIPPLRELGEGVRPRSGPSTHPKKPVTISSLLTPTTPSSSWANSSGIPSTKTTVDTRPGPTPSNKTMTVGEARPLVLTGGKSKPTASAMTTATGKPVTPKSSSLDTLSGHSKEAPTISKPASSMTSLNTKSSTKPDITTTHSTNSSAFSSTSVPKGPTSMKPSAPTGLKEKNKENTTSPSVNTPTLGGKPSGAQPSSQPQLNIPSVLNERPGANNSSQETPKMKPRSEPRYPTGGSQPGTTLSDLKRQRMEKYNRGSTSCNGSTNNNSLGASAAAGSGKPSSKISSLDSEIQNMFLTNVVSNRSPAHSSTLGKNEHSSVTDSKMNPNTVATQGTTNNNNNTTPRTVSMINGNQQTMRKFSASSSVQVIGGDDEKRKCCIII